MLKPLINSTENSSEYTLEDILSSIQQLFDHRSCLQKRHQVVEV